MVGCRLYEDAHSLVLSQTIGNISLTDLIDRNPIFVLLSTVTYASTQSVQPEQRSTRREHVTNPRDDGPAP
ncbi:MAG: hypothetical protein C0184_11420 [Chloroflexus aggregans]|uniref:Uncharacterized protein n=1 Tax=Chloroflexus aggregans TaxID=152260 RepID=A0A2J6X2C9_9CHLR|nr:MAG: hypothetical protein C0184_11420 [Chloroflexus aggregans]